MSHDHELCPREEVRIDLRQEYEIRHWSKAFGVSADELRRAVGEAGPVVKDVRRHLQHR